MSPEKFQGKVIIVTGSSSGIGQGIALLFGEQGAKVTIHGINATEVMETHNLMLEAKIPEDHILMVPGDVTESKTAQNLIEKTIAKWGQLDIPMRISTSLLTFEVNLKSIARVNKLATPYLEKTKGTIVNTASITGLKRVKGVPTFYAASKAALDHYIRYEAPGLAKKGIRINNLAPGLVVTNIKARVGFSKQWFDEMAKEHCEHVIPLGRCGTPRDMANAVSFLASDEAAYVCGTTLVVDGGAMLGKE
ncbi:hypothetical protein L596_025711 [Steinernema carpocapsae]|uniref:Ketoreductase (KR) domain-containing protein n=1 Tax=Steinernema carpocapsae TaxID=34508 RepID=A0A4U5M8L4_STECR|nr:hypothetical protein L596_025711 [Steinernema carpocapsae]